MKILVLDEEFPYPLNTGKRIRSFNLLKRIADKHELRYLAYGETGLENYLALEQAQMNPVPVAPQVPTKSGPLFYLRLLANLFSRDPYIVTSHYSQVYQDAVRREIASFSPDVVICEWTPYAVFMRDVPEVKTLVVAHNIESRIWQRYFEQEKQPIKKWYIKKQMQKVARFERDTFSSVTAATAVSQAEAEEMSEINPSSSIKVIQNGVDLDYFQVAPAPDSGLQVVFTGSMDWRPNQDAVLYFVREIFPKLRERLPTVEAVMVGRNPPPAIATLDSIEGISITGTVDDVRPFLRESAVCIVPLRIGGGSRLKILEALAMNRPVVSTSVGAEGLDVTDGETIFLADTVETFCEKTVRLLLDSALAEQMGQAGRTLVEQQYGWDALAGELDSFLNELVNDI